VPFPAGDYKRDFPGSVQAFRDLLTGAGPRVLEMDGAREPDDPEAKARAGELRTRSGGAAGGVQLRLADRDLGW
jgi:hypothetical protein